MVEAQEDGKKFSLNLSPTYTFWSYSDHRLNMNVNTAGIRLGASYHLPLEVFVGINRGAYQGQKSFRFDLYDDEKRNFNFTSLEIGLSYPVFRSKFIHLSVDFTRWNTHYFGVKLIQEKTVFGETTITRRETGIISESHNLLGLSTNITLHPRVSIKSTGMFEAYPYVSGLMFRTGLQFNVF